jgi:hypothetical protein
MKKAIIFSMILTIVVIILGASCTQNYESNSMNGNLMNSNSMNRNTTMNSNSTNGNLMNQNNTMKNSNTSKMMGLQPSTEKAK